MAQVGAQGFPTLVLETKAGLQSVDFAGYLGRPQEFQGWLRSQTNVSLAVAAADQFGCDANGCVA